MKRTYGFILCAVLAALAISGGICVYLFSEEGEASAGTPLLDLDFREIQSLRVTLQDGEILTFMRDEEEYWSLLEDPAFSFDQNKIAAIASFFSYLAPYAYAPEDAAPEELGLAAPQTVITAQLRDGTHHTICVGAQTADRSGIYLQVDGREQIGILDSYAAQTLCVTREALRNLCPPMIDWDCLEEIVISVPGEPDVTIRCLPGTGELPALRFPQWGVYAEAAVYHRFVREFSTLRFSAWIGEGTLARYGLEPPRRLYTFRDTKGVSAEIAFGQKAAELGGYYAAAGAWPGEVFLLDEEQASLMELAPLDLVDRHLFVRPARSYEELAAPPSPEETIRTLTIRCGGETTELSCRDGQFTKNGEAFPQEQGALVFSTAAALRTGGRVEAEAGEVFAEMALEGDGYAVETCTLYTYSENLLAVSFDGLPPAFSISRADILGLLSMVN